MRPFVVLPRLVYVVGKLDSLFGPWPLLVLSCVVLARFLGYVVVGRNVSASLPLYRFVVVGLFLQ